MVKVVCVLYDDPTTGYPPARVRDAIPTITKYPDGQSTPTPQAIDFTPGDLLGCVSGGLGLRKFLESRGHQFVVTSSKDGADSVLDRELADAEIVISQPFWPAYMTAERTAKAPKLKLGIFVPTLVFAWLAFHSSFHSRHVAPQLYSRCQ